MNMDDDLDSIYCADDDQYRVYCNIFDKLVIERCYKNYPKAGTHMKNIHKRQRLNITIMNNSSKSYLS